MHENWDESVRHPCHRCASEGEEQAALYNMACAYAALRQLESALTCLEGAFEAGLSDYAAVRTDADLDAVRGPELDKLMSKCVLCCTCCVP